MHKGFQAMREWDGLLMRSVDVGSLNRLSSLTNLPEQNGTPQYLHQL